MPVRLAQTEVSPPDGLALDYRPIASLIPYARNARTHSEAQVALIAGSIREYGFTNPVLVDGENGIIAGHGRVLAARKLGLASVPVIELGHLSESQKRAYVLADNRLALQAGWDKELLALEAADLARDGRRPRHPRLRGGGDRRAAQRRRRRPARGGDTGAARRTCFSARRPLAPRTASAALRQRHRPGRTWSGSWAACEPHLMATDPPYGVSYDPAWRNRAGLLRRPSARAR